jgi:hypothetical protein
MLLRSLIEKWSLYLTLVVNVLGVVLVRLQVLSADQYLPFILFSLTVFFMYQLSFNHKLEKKIDDLSVMNERARKVGTAEFYKLFRRYVGEAKVSIDLTIHLGVNPEASQSSEIKSYFKEIDRIIRSNKVRVRRITTVSSREKLDIVKGWCERYSKSDWFFMKYSPIKDDHLPPPLSVMIIDKKITLLAGVSAGFHRLSSEDMDLIIEGEESSAAFLAYYEAYWNSLEFIKDGKNVNFELLERLEESV